MCRVNTVGFDKFLEMKFVYVIGHLYSGVDDADFKNDDKFSFNLQSRSVLNLFFSLLTIPRGHSWPRTGN